MGKKAHKDQSPALHVVNKINCHACKNSIGPVALRHYCEICKIFFCNPCYPRANHEHQCYSNKNILPKLHNIRNIANLVASENRANLPIVEVIRKRRTSYAKDVSKRITKMLCKQFQTDLEETFKQHRDTLAKAQKKINEIHSSKSRTGEQTAQPNTSETNSDSDTKQSTMEVDTLTTGPDKGKEVVPAVDVSKALIGKHVEKKLVSDRVLDTVLEDAIKKALTLAQQAILPDSELITVRIEKGEITIYEPAEEEPEVPKVKEPPTKGRKKNGKLKQPLVIEPIRTFKRELMDQVKVKEALKATELLSSMCEVALKKKETIVSDTDKSRDTTPKTLIELKDGKTKTTEIEPVKASKAKQTSETKPESIGSESVADLANVAATEVKEEAAPAEITMCLEPEVVAEVVMGVEPAVMRIKPLPPTPPPPSVPLANKDKAAQGSTATLTDPTVAAAGVKGKAAKGKGVPGVRKKPGPKPGSKRKRDNSKGALQEDKAAAPAAKKKRAVKAAPKSRGPTPIPTMKHQPTKMELEALASANAAGVGIKKTKNRNVTPKPIVLQRDGETNVILAPEGAIGIKTEAQIIQDELRKKELSEKLLKLAEIEDHKKSQEMIVRTAANTHPNGVGYAVAGDHERTPQMQGQGRQVVDVDQLGAENKNMGGKNMRNSLSQTNLSRQDYTNTLLAQRQEAAYNSQITREKLLQQRRFLEQKESVARGMPNSNSNSNGNIAAENAAEIRANEASRAERMSVSGRNNRENHRMNPYAREQADPTNSRSRGDIERTLRNRAEFEQEEDKLRNQRLYERERERELDLLARERYQQAQALRSRQPESMQLEQLERERMQLQRDRQAIENAQAARTLQRNESMRFGRNATDAEKAEYQSERARLAMQDEMEMVDRDPEAARGGKGSRGNTLGRTPSRGMPRDGGRGQGMRALADEFDPNSNLTKLEQWRLMQERENKLRANGAQQQNRPMEDRRRALAERASGGVGMDAAQGRQFQENNAALQRQATAENRGLTRGEGSTNMLAPRLSREALTSNQRRLKTLQTELQIMDPRDPNRPRLLAEFESRKDFEKAQPQVRSTPQMQAQGATEAMARGANAMKNSNGSKNNATEFNSMTPSQSRAGVPRDVPPAYVLGRQGTGPNRGAGNGNNWRGQAGQEPGDESAQYAMARQQQQQQRQARMSPSVAARMEIKNENLAHERMRDSIRGEGGPYGAANASMNSGGNGRGEGGMNISDRERERERMSAQQSERDRLGAQQRSMDARGARGGLRGDEGMRGSYANVFEQSFMQGNGVTGSKGGRDAGELMRPRASVDPNNARARAHARQRGEGMQNYTQQQQQQLQQQQMSIEQRSQQQRQLGSMDRGEGMLQQRANPPGKQDRWQGMGLQTGDRRPMNPSFDAQELTQRDGRREVGREYR